MRKRKGVFIRGFVIGMFLSVALHLLWFAWLACVSSFEAYVDGRAYIQALDVKDQIEKEMHDNFVLLHPSRVRYTRHGNWYIE